MKFFTIIGILVLVVFIVGCFVKYKETHSNISNTNKNMSLPNFNNDRKTSSKWSVEKLNSNINSRITRIFFLDSENIFAISVSNLYKVNQFGKLLDEIKIPIQGDESIVNMSFFDVINGLIVVQKSISYSSESYANEFRMLLTKNGGKTWEENLIVKGGKFISFSNVAEGQILLAGLKYEDQSSVCFNPILLTFDKYKLNWEWEKSYSKPLSVDKNKKCMNEAVMGSLITDGRVSIITSKKQIFQKTIGEANWEKFYEYEIIDEQSGVKAFGINDNKNFWFLEGTNSQEGTRGRLITIDDKGKSFPSVSLDMFYLDAAYIQNDDFLICGAKIDYKAGKDLKVDLNAKNGIILQTNDGGQSVTEVFSKIDERIISLHSVSEDDSIFWAIGENGSILKLTRN